MQGYYDDQIKLRTVISGIKDGFATETVTEKTVFAEKKSVGRAEFYLSAQSGMKVDVIFAVRAADFDDETEIEYSDKSYDVVRTYQKDKDNVELVCVRRPG